MNLQARCLLRANQWLLQPRGCVRLGQEKRGGPREDEELIEVDRPRLGPPSARAAAAIEVFGV